MSIFDSVRRWRDTLRKGETAASAPAPAAPKFQAPQAPAAGTPPQATPDVALSPALRPSPDDVSDTAIEAAAEDHVAAVEIAYEGPERRERNRVNARPGTRALIVDDSNVVVAVLRKMLQQNGFQTYEAYTAEEALELARALVPEIIFLDIVLPGMDGFAALRTLRREPATRDVPIIMMSGNMLATEQFYVQRIGADDFMKKPFSRPEVFIRIERLLDNEGVPRRSGKSAQNA